MNLNKTISTFKVDLEDTTYSDEQGHRQGQLGPVRSSKFPLVHLKDDGTFIHQ